MEKLKNLGEQIFTQTVFCMFLKNIHNYLILAHTLKIGGVNFDSKGHWPGLNS